MYEEVEVPTFGVIKARNKVGRYLTKLGCEGRRWEDDGGQEDRRDIFDETGW